MEDDLIARIDKLHKTVVSPLVRDKKFKELSNRLIVMLKTEEDQEFRIELMTNLCSWLDLAGDRTGSIKWAETCVEEFEDNHRAWTCLAGMYFYALSMRPDKEDGLKSLGYYQNALEKARQKDEWVRDILFDICRLLTSMKDYDRLADYMREIIADLENKREIDIPFLEADWLKRVPDGAIDENMRRTYEAFLKADNARRRASANEEGPPTREDLEKFR